ncbi:GLPGLI family protein [Chryseobacterium luquanense]|uniref:GLPGLI family protein n=1 Tax=Chryseobacterium luquanense TaxID=2983766 RepID=A0ABT3Y5I5_9FLAO|nr:GLPGLI family protein [Chryseobacterium luquanense]MCX8533403.1 GLPGLI family protein [Chryseobacterium luquanense]
MKLKLIFLLFISNFFFAQKPDSSFIECKYLTTFLIDSANTHTLKKELAYLRIGKNSSIFRSDFKEKADSITFAEIDKSNKNPVNGIAIMRTENWASAKYIPEVIKRNGEIIIFDKILNVTYNYPAVEKVQWSFLNETKKIREYTCKKAVGKYHNKSITVWYTEEIPISEGPYTFKNLPGLVLEAYDSKDYFHFTLESLKRVVKPIVPLDRAVKTDYERFSKKRAQVFNDPIGAFVGIFGKTPPKENQESMISNIRSINNYLD